MQFSGTFFAITFVLWPVFLLAFDAAVTHEMTVRALLQFDIIASCLAAVGAMADFILRFRFDVAVGCNVGRLVDGGCNAFVTRFDTIIQNFKHTCQSLEC